MVFEELFLRQLLPADHQKWEKTSSDSCMLPVLSLQELENKTSKEKVEAKVVYCLQVPQQLRGKKAAMRSHILMYIKEFT